MIKYYLRNKKVSARLQVYFRVESTNHQKIGEIIKALQICKQSTQTAFLQLNAFKSYSTLDEMFQFCFCHFYTIFK